MPRKIDQFFKSKVGNHTTPYRQEDWKAFEAMLDSDKVTGYSSRLLWLVSLFILLSFILFLPGANILTGVENVEETQIESVKKPSGLGSAIKVTTDRSIQNSRSRSLKTANLSSQFLPAYSQSNEFASDNFISNSYSKSSFSSTNSLSKKNSVSPFHEDFGTFQGSGFTGSIMGKGLLFSGTTPFLDNLSTEELYIDPAEYMPNERNEIKYNQASRMGYGIGMLIGDENLTDFGFFAELIYPLNSLFNISARPGILLTSVNGHTALYSQEQYDFGRSVMEIELETTHRLQVDIPIFLSMDMNRHRLGIGGGVRFNVAERYEETQTRISDKNRVGGLAIKERVVDRSAWQNSSTDIRPFIEGSYQYQIHPNWFLGFRTRLTFDSSLSEVTESANRVQYGVILTYALN